MRKPCSIVTVLFVAAATLVGCDGGGGTTETVPFKETDASQFKGMLPAKPGARPKAAAPTAESTPP